MDSVARNLVNEVCTRHEADAVELLPVLLELQARSGQNYISQAVATEVARALNVSESRVFEVVTYFAALSDQPRGEYLIQICESTACSVVGINHLAEWFGEELGIQIGETTADKKFTLMATHCIGACDVAPAIRINNEVYGHLTRDKVRELIQERRTR